MIVNLEKSQVEYYWLSTVVTYNNKSSEIRTDAIEWLFAILHTQHSETISRDNSHYSCHLCQCEKYAFLTVRKFIFFPQLTYADLAFFDFANRFAQGKIEVPEQLKPYPKLLTLYNRVMSTPNIHKWLETRPQTEM